MEPPGSRDEDLGAAGLLRLPADGGSAVDGRDPQVAGRGERLQVGDDLRGELAGRDEHECARVPVGADRPLDHRDAEREGLAGAGRRRGQDVDAGESVGEDEVLDCERRGDAEAVENPDYGRAHSERRKRLRHAFLPVEKRSRCKSLETPGSQEEREAESPGRRQGDRTNTVAPGRQAFAGDAFRPASRKVTSRRCSGSQSFRRTARRPSMRDRVGTEPRSHSSWAARRL